MKFRKDFKTCVPTEMLIEDYQILSRIVEKIEDRDAKEDVYTVMECLAQAVSDYTRPDQNGFQPSVSSQVRMDMSIGILSRDDDSDIQCASGRNVSEVMDFGYCQCSEACMKLHGCDPEHSLISLSEEDLNSGFFED